MADEPVSIGEEVATATLIALIRRAMLDAADIRDMSLSDEARDVANSALLEAAAPSDREWAAGQARDRFRVIEGGGE